MYTAAPPAGVDSSDAAHKEQASANGDPSADSTADAKTEAAGTEADGSDSKTDADEAKTDAGDAKTDADEAKTDAGDAKTDQAGSPEESTDADQAGSPKESTDGEISACSVVIYSL